MAQWDLFLVLASYSTHVTLVPRLYLCARTQTNQKVHFYVAFSALSDWFEYECTVKLATRLHCETILFRNDRAVCIQSTDLNWYR